MTLKRNCEIFAVSVSLLASLNTWAASTTTAPAASSSTTQAKKVVDSSPKFNARFEMSRSTSLVDFKDGSRSDSIDYLLRPSVSFSFGKIKSDISYTQNLRDQFTKTENDFGDIPVTFDLKPTQLKIFKDQTSVLIYSLITLLPVSQNSIKRDQLQTALSARILFATEPTDGQGISFNTSVSVGRNFHAFSENINGQVLNQYSSNQSIGLGYGISDFSLSWSFLNRSRLTYQNNTKNTFEMSEELEYSVNDNFTLAVGHTNAGKGLKDNGTDSNIELINENTSVVYGTLGLTY